MLQVGVLHLAYAINRSMELMISLLVIIAAICLAIGLPFVFKKSSIVLMVSVYLLLFIAVMSWVNILCIVL